jgi:hypothetical protein
MNAHLSRDETAAKMGHPTKEENRRGGSQSTRYGEEAGNAMFRKFTLSIALMVMLGIFIDTKIQLRPKADQERSVR